MMTAVNNELFQARTGAQQGLYYEGSVEVKGLLHLLMKYRLEGQPWKGAEKKEIRMHLRNISKVVPIVTIFLLPGGAFLLPFLVDVLGRKES